MDGKRAMRRQRTCCRPWIFVLACLSLAFAALLTGQAFHADQALAKGKQRASVLVLEAGLGDYDLCSLHWLGDDSEKVGTKGKLKLTTADKPTWWETAGGTGRAPATFVLGSAKDGAQLGTGEIVWALNQIRESGAEPKTFVVAMGNTGLALRGYAEDLAPTKQSARADLVGMAFCGTAQNGYSAISGYADLELWGLIASSTGNSVGDITPQSRYLNKLNGTPFPNVCKALSINGEVGDLGFGTTDGAGTTVDFAIPSAVSDQVETARVNATISRSVNLTGQWQPYTSSIDHPGQTVDAQLTERLSALDSYEISTEVQSKVREFYESWFAESTPVTHLSSVLALDLSGSMLESIDSGNDKLSAAKKAAKEYLSAAQGRSEMPYAAPMDVKVYGFNTGVTKIAEGMGKAARQAVDGMTARGETNIGKVLEAAVNALDSAPPSADKTILLLSDGASTRGQSEKSMLGGVVAKAKRRGIAIDAIGFGNTGESDASFLKKVAKKTGGSYYRASDTYSLEVNFLKSYYSSLGLNLVDKEIGSGASAAQALGTVDQQTTALEIGIVAEGSSPTITLTCNGTPLDQSSYTVQKEENGFQSVQCTDPQPGEYAMGLSDGSGKAHVFAVKQQGISKGAQPTEQKADYSLYLLIGAGVVLALAIAVIIMRTLRKKKTE